MLIGMLFVLLAAGVRLQDVRDLGWLGVLSVAVLMFVIRPLNVAVSTWNADLTWREKAFVAWLAPRGIVAAAVASLFAQSLTANGIPGGDQLEALVFTVIAVTVLVQGLSGGLVARLLGLVRPSSRGVAILGANELGHTLGRLLRDSGQEVIFLDSNPGACNVVQVDGFKVIYGNVLEERTLERAQLEGRAACIAVTPNDEANLLFARRAIEEFKMPRTYVALTRGGGGVTEAIVRQAGGTLLFGIPRDLELWALRLRRGMAPIEIWRYGEPPASGVQRAADPFDTPKTLCLPLVVWRGERVFPANRADGLVEGDVVHFAVFREHGAQARAWLRENGWRAAEEEEADRVGKSRPAGAAERQGAAPLTPRPLG
jgi:hypothetical protein